MYEAMKRRGFFVYGKTVPGAVLQCREEFCVVLNERTIRVGAGIMWMLGSFAFVQAFYLHEYVYIKLLVVFFFFDFLMKVLVGIKFSPISRLASVLTATLPPVFVPAKPKRFAWGIGLVLSSIMIVLVHGFQVQGLFNIAICLACLSMMFLESVFGICVGCMLYSAITRTE